MLASNAWLASRLAVLGRVQVAPKGDRLDQPAAAQSDDERDLTAIASWVALDVATGYETRTADRLEAGFPGWQADRWGNLVRRVGSGRPRRVVACGLDRPSYAASQITEDGYLRVHRIGRGSAHPLWTRRTRRSKSGC